MAKAAKKEEQQGKITEVSYEDMINEIEVILTKLDDKELLLDQAVNQYKDGIGLIEKCQAKLDLVEKELKIIENK